MRIIHWFRRDLRLTDNPALEWACTHADALCLVYIHAPQDEAPWTPGAASNWWLNASLAALAQQLSAQGQQLIIRNGHSLEQLRTLAQEFKADAVCWNRLYEPAALARDQRIKQSLSEQGLSVRSHNAALLLEPWQVETGGGTPYRVFTPFWKSAQQQLPPPQAVAAAPQDWPAATQLHSESLDTLALHPSHRWADKLAGHWVPGEEAALDQLDAFAERIADYAQARDIPGRDGTSRLSPHLHFGELGPRQIRAALSTCVPQDADKYMSELGWREFAHHLLYHFPHTPQNAFNPRFAQFPWRDASTAQDDLRLWQRGETGIELVDAGMRELWATGWMHNRVRMIVGSLLTKNLGIHWLAGANWFWDTLVDADLANNTLGWQWVAGCGADASPYFRIFNPDTQAQRFDPDRRYRDRWLNTPPPAPIVDLKQSRAQALERYKKVRNASA